VSGLDRCSSLSLDLDTHDAISSLSLANKKSCQPQGVLSLLFPNAIRFLKACHAIHIHIKAVCHAGLHESACIFQWSSSFPRVSPLPFPPKDGIRNPVQWRCVSVNRTDMGHHIRVRSSLLTQAHHHHHSYATGMLVPHVCLSTSSPLGYQVPRSSPRWSIMCKKPSHHNRTPSLDLQPLELSFKLPVVILQQITTPSLPTKPHVMITHKWQQI
jgi:hypothetical protein